MNFLWLWERHAWPSPRSARESYPATICFSARTVYAGHVPLDRRKSSVALGFEASRLDNVAVSFQAAEQSASVAPVLHIPEAAPAATPATKSGTARYPSLHRRPLTPTTRAPA